MQLIIITLQVILSDFSTLFFFERLISSIWDRVYITSSIWDRVYIKLAMCSDRLWVNTLNLTVYSQTPGAIRILPTSNCNSPKHVIVGTNFSKKLYCDSRNFHTRRNSASPILPGRKDFRLSRKRRRSHAKHAYNFSRIVVQYEYREEAIETTLGPEMLFWRQSHLQFHNKIDFICCKDNAHFYI